jgi:uncharacterized protein YqjF (DUF2071 family)
VKAKQTQDPRPFLTAEWRHLLLLNYEIQPEVLQPLVPSGTELDLWQGKALVSMVGFLFRRTRLLGLPVPFHTNFEEVNLRFYVRRPGDDARRGVVFVKEIVPMPMIANTARILYGENYQALPMGHTVEEKDGQICPEGLVEYTWRFRGRLHRLGGLALGESAPLEPGSEAEFITEHYWGYTRRGPKRTGAYRVAHPAWRVRPVAQPYLLCDVAALYGAAFAPYLRRPPSSAFLADGSPVAVYWGEPVRGVRG